MEEEANTSTMEEERKPSPDNSPGPLVIEVETASEVASKRSASSTTSSCKSA